jgi:hypothetical protein
MLRHHSTRHIFPAALALLPPEMCSSLHVRSLFLSHDFSSLLRCSICLVVFTLLVEVPPDVAYYWK